MLNYEDRYINHADIPETRARARRYKAFKEATGFIEILNKESHKHVEICKYVRIKTHGHLNHITFLELGYMTIVLTEPYQGKLKDFNCDELYTVEIPVDIAPYGGKCSASLETNPGTKSFLITTRLKQRQLDEVLQRLEEQSEKMALWNFIREDSK
ncbi:hypothetical protein N8011_01205 [Pseudomonadota bacterium]|jgi:hypothetical protein|nr:hypothetical protein [Pseudomonadota bacterium]